MQINLPLSEIKRQIIEDKAKFKMGDLAFFKNHDTNYGRYEHTIVTTQVVGISVVVSTNDQVGFKYEVRDINTGKVHESWESSLCNKKEIEKILFEGKYLCTLDSN